MTREENRLYFELIREFDARTGVPVLLNTSFNENEPIVCTPREAIDCFERTKMDALAIGPFICSKRLLCGGPGLGRARRVGPGKLSRRPELQARKNMTTQAAGGPLRVNVGCGGTPTPGWLNIDNSLSVRLANWPRLARVLSGLRLIDEGQLAFVRSAAQGHGIVWANAAERLPCADDTVEVVYSSHMLEHLDRDEACRFLREVLRILRPGGVLRLALPDIARGVARYLETGDADEFVSSTLLSGGKPRSLVGRLKLAMVGPRHHLWMYDGPSLCRSAREGFVDSIVLPPGRTTIADPGSLNLREREEESVYVECRKPPAAEIA